MPTLTVTTNADSGAGSLRVQIGAAANGDTIVFSAALAGQTITLTSGQILIAKDLTITGLGANALTLNAGGTRAFRVEDTGTVLPRAVVISGLTITGGGGESAVAEYTENLTLDGVVLTGNAAEAFYASFGSLTITNSTLSNNASAGTHGVAGQAAGANLTVSNSTVTGNTGGAGVQGGAFYITGNSTNSISNSTIVGNTAASAGGFYVGGGANLTVTNSIIAGNIGGGTPNFDFQAAIFGPPFGGVTLSYTLLGSTVGAIYTDGGNNLINVAADLGALANNGGTVPTMLPNVGSPVINAGNPAFAAPPATDERGLARISGGRVDLGAVELQAVVVAAAPAATPVQTPAPPPTVAPTINANFSGVLGALGFGVNAPPATVTTPTGQVLPNPLLDQQKAVQALIVKVDAGTLTLKAAQDIIVDMADATTSVATMGYQFFTGKLPTKDGLAFLVSSPENPNDLNDGFYAGMSVENRYINMAVNLAKPPGPGVAFFQTTYGSLSLTDATAKAYAEIFGKTADASKLTAILTSERAGYFLSLGGDALGQKAAMVGWLLGEAAKSDTGPYAARNENFLYDLLDGTAAFGADGHIYDNAGPIAVGLVGVMVEAG